jgi:fermentation-respiration switch protein FrsA (DUF1100 family)
MMQTAGVVLAVLLAYFVFSGAWENKIIFHPYKYPEGIWNPEAYGLQVEDVYFQSGDGVKLHGWFVKGASAPKDGATLLWFHGNAGNLSHRLEHILLLRKLGLDIFIFDYRGYGKSEGQPDELGIYRDSLAAYRVLVDARNVRPESLFLYGQSLGGACAIEVALQCPAGGLILEATFTSTEEMAGLMFPFLPVKFLVRSKFNSIDKIPLVAMPKLFVHGTQDSIVPFSMGRKLFDAAREPKEFLKIPNADHNDNHIVGAEEYFHAFAKFVQKNHRNHVP